MRSLAFGAGLTPRLPSPPLPAGLAEEALTEEMGVVPPAGQTARVTPLVEEGVVVAEGTALAALRDEPDVLFVAPMASRVARIGLLPGRRLVEIVLFREAGGDVLSHDLSGAGTEEGLRRLLQAAGLWPRIGRRPFGGMPGAAERPAAIVVMATDTRPFAPDPASAIAGREEDFARGLDALGRLTGGPVFVCRGAGGQRLAAGRGGGQVRDVVCGPRHPRGSAGICIHGLFPAGLDAPVWDLHAEDVADIGALLATGVAPMLRHVTVAGPALREARLVRTQAGADMRGLAFAHLEPGGARLLAGSALEGREGHWLGPRDRQVTALPRPGQRLQPHWLVDALTRSARPAPAIPSSALTQAFGAALPAAPFVRALTSGDDETAMKLGLLSLTEEDIALADYVLGGDADLRGLLRGMLERVRREYAA